MGISKPFWEIVWLGWRWCKRVTNDVVKFLALDIKDPYSRFVDNWYCMVVCFWKLKAWKWWKENLFSISGYLVALWYFEAISLTNQKLCIVREYSWEFESSIFWVGLHVDHGWDSFWWRTYPAREAWRRRAVGEDGIGLQPLCKGAGIFSWAAWPETGILPLYR